MALLSALIIIFEKARGSSNTTTTHTSRVITTIRSVFPLELSSTVEIRSNYITLSCIRNSLGFCDSAISPC